MATSSGQVLVSGTANLASAGTAQVISTATIKVKSVVIVARAANSGQIVLGGADVATSTNNGLNGGESLTLSSASLFDLKEIYFDGGSTGDDVDWYAMRE